MRDNSSKSGGKTAMMKRKGPWTEQEDAQLVWFVRLLGERRWDFLAQVSGLRRTGKSCRLRWVNYLHPGLKRGRMTAEEERLILQLHSQWGSRWSRIARRLPGRTDNEIKNYWRTLTRKLTKKTTTTATPETEKKKDSSSPTASDSSSSSASSSSSLTASAETGCGTEEEMGGGTEEAGETEEETTAASEKKPEKDMEMEELWNEIAAAEMAAAAASWPGLHAEELLLPPSSPPAWEDYSLWRIDDQEYYSKMEHAALR